MASEARRFEFTFRTWDGLEEVKDEAGKFTGFKRINERDETLVVNVLVDFEALARKLGLKAFRSKGRKAVEAGGLVEVHLAR